MKEYPGIFLQESRKVLYDKLLLKLQADICHEDCEKYNE